MKLSRHLLRHILTNNRKVLVFPESIGLPTNSSCLNLLYSKELKTSLIHLNKHTLLYTYDEVKNRNDGLIKLIEDYPFLDEIFFYIISMMQ